MCISLVSHAFSGPPVLAKIVCNTLCVASTNLMMSCSHIMPEKKDFKTVENKGKCEHIKRRLVLRDLRGVYHEFKERIPHCKIGVSKFVELRSKRCVLAGTSGTHSVCVCTIHQSVKLMSMV